jgi:hypothetical protein
MNRIAALILVLFFCGLTAVNAQQVVLRTTVASERVWVGQKAILYIDVLVDAGWAQLVKIDTAVVDDVYLLQLESQGTRLSETIEGNSYTGQRYEIMLFARRGGVIDIPPLPVEVEVKTWGAGGGSELLQMQTPAASLEAELPAAAENIRNLVSTSGFTATQSWQPEPENMQTGDAIKRTITLQAVDLPGMVLMPTRFIKIEGVGMYPGEPIVSDRYDRGELTGTRIDTVSYVFEQAGKIEIPALEFSWWDVSSETLQQVELEGVSIDVSPVVTETKAAGVITEDEQQSWLVTAVVLVAGLCALFFLFRKRIADYLDARRKARADSESRYFKRVIRSLRSGDDKGFVRELMRWLDRINEQDRPALLGQFLSQYGDSELEQLINQSLHGSGAAGRSNSSQIINGLKAARKRWRATKQPGSDAPYVLAEMNQPLAH